MVLLWLVGQLALGLLVLYFGAEFFLNGAVRLARRLGISPFMIGLTLVGFATSAPELAVNLSAVLGGSNDIAVGNIIGSNISNIGLILGSAALVMPLVVQMRLLKRELPILIVVSFLLYGLAWDGELSRIDAAILLALLVATTIYVYRTGRKEKEEVKQEFEHLTADHDRKSSVGMNLLLVILGLAGMVGGAELMVRAAVEMARLWGLSELMIGLTIVAVGTSLPELASSLVAARRGETDIAVGNVIGSNLFNILLILGTTAAITPLPVAPEAIRTEMPIMLGFTLLLIPVLGRSYRVGRRDGVLLVLAYAAFLAWQAYQSLYMLAGAAN